MSDFGIGLGMTAAQGLGNYLVGEANRKRSIEAQKQMANYMYNLEMKKWKNTNYSAQMNEISKAGLSPSLLYSGKGGGGSISSQTQGGGQQASFNINPVDLAQIDVAKAQAEKLRAEANTIKGETERGRQEIDNLGQVYENLMNDANIKDTERRYQIDVYESRVKQEAYKALQAAENIKVSEAEWKKKFIEMDKITNDIVRDNKQLFINSVNSETDRLKAENMIKVAIENRETSIITALINQGGNLVNNLVKGLMLKNMPFKSITNKWDSSGKSSTTITERLD